MKRSRFFALLSVMMLLLTGCQEQQVIVTAIDEKEANLIVVFLESKGITASKTRMSTGGAEVAGQAAAPKFNIMVQENKTVDALAILNRNGLPRKQGTNLLELFSKQGLTSTDKEETIRYQAGLAQQITNTILMIDGVLDASVQVSFPPEETTPGETQEKQITAAVYVKHQGIVDDPNSHLENKIKRLVAGSISGLDINNVTVVSDRARLSEASPEGMMGKEKAGKEYVKIWSIILSSESAGKFRSLFFFLLFAAIILAAISGWIIWKIYPTLRQKGGIKKLISPKPFETNTQKSEKKEGP